MRIGMVGLGRMGLNMTRRLQLGGHHVVAYDISPKGVKEAVGHGAEGAGSLRELVGKLKSPRYVWLMVPAGKPVDDAVDTLAGLLGKGDTVIDGGNSHFKDAERHMSRLIGAGINFLDVGTSGGIWGLKEGYCLMIGGDEKAYKKLLPVFRTLAPKDGYLY